MTQTNLESLDKELTTDTVLRKYGFWNGVVTALSIFFAQIIVAIIASLIGLGLAFSGGFEIDNVFGLIMGITLIVAFPLAVWWVLRSRKLAAEAWVWKNEYWKLLLISFLMTFGTAWVIGVILELFPFYEDMVKQYAEMFEGLNPFLLIIGGAVIGPICEEIIFRGIILKEFLLRYDYKKAILYSSIIFSAIHMMPLQVIATFPVGLVLGYIYYKTNSLWLVSIIHIINNTLSFTFGTEQLASGESTRDWFGNDLLFVGSMILVMALVYGMYVLFERYQPDQSAEQVRELS